MHLDLLVEGAAEVFDGEAVVAGGLVGVAGGRVAFVGPDVPPGWTLDAATRRLDARGGLVTPGLVDPHTHVVFAGDRSGEYAERAAGRPYLEIAAAGGGIAATMRATRAADLEALVALARPRLDRLLACGVTTAESKSGYGLDLATEIRILEATAALSARHPIDLVGTFLGAHTVPPERRADRQAYLDEVVEVMIPAVASRGLAEFCDVFVERGAFSAAEGERVLRAGLAHGLRPKVHADQLTACGGAELAGRVGATSADHLEHVSEAGVAALAAAGTVAVLLPGAAIFLGDDSRAPARRLIEAGVPVALATDCNPGTCMTEDLLLMLTLGMSRLGLSPLEALRAVTVHAAQAIGRADVAGRLAPGRPADVAVFAVPSHAHLPYRFGLPPTRVVLKGGEVVYTRDD
ncbi:MAG: imidazolonepropionase [Myxococcales bacterium]|nr:imidazolonepropionase [Myxococcales bacterium]